MLKAILITESFLNNFKDPKSKNESNFNQLPKVLKSYLEENKDKIYFHFLISENSGWLAELNSFSRSTYEKGSYNAAKEGYLINTAIKNSDGINIYLTSEILILAHDGYNLIKGQKKKVQKTLTGLIPFHKSHPKFTFGAIIPFAVGLACLTVGTVLTFTGVFSPLGAAMTLAGINTAFSSITTFGLATAGLCGMVGVVSTWVATVFTLNVIKTINAFKRIFKLNSDKNHEKSDNTNSKKKINGALSSNEASSALKTEVSDNKKQDLIVENSDPYNADKKNISSPKNIDEPIQQQLVATEGGIVVAVNQKNSNSIHGNFYSKGLKSEIKTNSHNESEHDSDDESFHSFNSNNESNEYTTNSP